MVDGARKRDGGWGWIVVTGAFCSHAVVFGIVYSFGIIFLSLEENFNGTKTEIAWIPSLTSGSLHSSGLLASMLVRRFGCRVVTIIGAITSSIGFILSMFAPNIYYLYVTMGLLAGCGFGLAFMPAVLIVTQYFSRLRSVACGIALSGCGIGAFIFSPLLKFILDKYSLKGTFLILSAIVLNCIPCGLVFLPVTTRQGVSAKQRDPECDKCDNADELYSLVKHERNTNTITDEKNHDNADYDYDETRQCNDCINKTPIANTTTEEPDNVYKDNETTSDVPNKADNVIAWSSDAFNTSETDSVERITIEHCDERHIMHGKERPNSVTETYLFLLKRGETMFFFMSQFLYVFGFYIPVIFIPDKAKGLGINKASSAWVASVIGISSISGRVILGYIADRPSVNRLLMFKITILISGLSTSLGPLLNSLWLMMVYAVIYGVTAGFTISVTSVITLDLVGLDHLTEALGIVSLFSGVGSVLGPPFAGFLYDTTGSYTAPFLASGASLLLAGVLMFLATVCRKNQNK